MAYVNAGTITGTLDTSGTAVTGSINVGTGAGRALAVVVFSRNNGAHTISGVTCGSDTITAAGTSGGGGQFTVAAGFRAFLTVEGSQTLSVDPSTGTNPTDVLILWCVIDGVDTGGSITDTTPVFQGSVTAGGTTSITANTVNGDQFMVFQLLRETGAVATPSGYTERPSGATVGYNNLRGSFGDGTADAATEVLSATWNNVGTVNGHAYAYSFPNAASGGTADFGGTLDGATEQDVRSGGETLTITLTDDTWVASGTTFDAQRQAILDGLAASGDNLFADCVPANVVRTSDTVVTITLPAIAGFQITGDSTVTGTIPAAALVTSADPVSISGTVTIARGAVDLVQPTGPTGEDGTPSDPGSITSDAVGLARIVCTIDGVALPAVVLTMRTPA